MKRVVAGVLAVLALLVAVGAAITREQPTAQRAVSLALPRAVASEMSGSFSTVPSDLFEASLALSAKLYDQAPAVVLTTSEALDDAAAGLPVLVVDARPDARQLEKIEAELVRLGAAGVMLHGVTADIKQVHRPVKTQQLTCFVMTDNSESIGLAHAYGATVLPLEDPRGNATSIAALAAAPEAPVFQFGAGSEEIGWQVAVARTGSTLPTGTQLAVPAFYVALYGHPGTASLGMLGEQDTEATIARAADMADSYRQLVSGPVIPALEIIATVASAEAGDDGNYSRETPVDELEPLVTAAREAGQYVVLDLQPGRTDFVTQAEQYAPLLAQPHVGLALDPEWRLEPDQVHLRQIGHVEISEVNQVVQWLADFTRERQLPQKVLVLHAFSTAMLPDIGQLDTSRSELAIVLHVDGQGSQGGKQGTWRTLHEYAPNVPYWGWKNFVEEDTPAMLTPEQTVAEVSPTPTFVSYQ